MTKTSVLTSMFALALAGGVARADEMANRKFCEQMTKVHTDVKALDSTTSSKTLAQLRASSQKVITDAQNLQMAGSKMNTASSKELDTAAKALKKDLNALPEDITVEQARQKLDSDITDVRNAVQKLSAEAGCAAGTEDKSSEKPIEKQDKSMDKQDKMPQEKNSMDRDSDIKQ